MVIGAMVIFALVLAYSAWIAPGDKSRPSLTKA